VTSDELSSLLLPLILVVIFWLLVIRPARRRQRELVAAQSAAQPGARVMLSSGLYGEVTAVDDTDISLTIARGVTVKVHRQAIAKVVEPTSGSTGSGGASAASSIDAPDRSTDR
jgi:preprotein translocase subunit YajC